MEESLFSKLRNKSFSARYEMPQPLIDAARQEKSHYFLTNPTALVCYLYLVDYVKRILEQEHPKGNHIRILDWGCGKGHISYILKQYITNAEVISCDISGDLAKGDSTFGQKTPIIDTFKIEIVPLTHEYLVPFSDNSFDIVLSIGVLEHVPNDQASLKEINRILKPEGLFFCTFLPYTYSWTQKVAHMMGDNYHDRLYDWKIVETLLSNSNFQLIDQWHRALFPKNEVNFPAYRTFEKIDQWLCEHTPLKHLATNIEFVARKLV